MIQRNGSKLVGLGVVFILLVLSQTTFGQQRIDWTTQADSLRGRNSQRFAFICPPNGTVSSRLWGSGVYTDDSSICTAAVHAGAINVVSGGTVTIEIRPPNSSYASSGRNGVTSKSYGSWSGSFVVVGGRYDQPEQRYITWATQADSLRGRNGERFTYVCPVNGTASGRLWGSAVYTDDSSICTAAVHAGVINVVSGGNVTIEIRPASSSYAASTRNGVTSRSYGSFSGSFVVIGGRYDEREQRQITWSTQADYLRGRNGERFTYVCPGNGTASGRLWGSGVYTDDSSICTAAVHAGLINVGSGGTVTIEIRPGAPSYEASSRNGINSRSYGSWGGSFVFVR